MFLKLYFLTLPDLIVNCNSLFNVFNSLIKISFFFFKAEETIDKRQTLLYDHSFSPKPTHGEIKFSREYLKQMCRSGFPNIQREFPDSFVKFLSASKQLSLNTLQQLLNRAGSICTNGK